MLHMSLSDSMLVVSGEFYIPLIDFSNSVRILRYIIIFNAINNFSYEHEVILPAECLNGINSILQ